jgi:type I restriction enzyme, S subunit
VSLPCYPRYKDTAVAWLGEVPEGWKIVRLKNLAHKIGSGKTPLGGNEVYVADGVLFLRSQNVYDDGLYLDDSVFIASEVDEAMKSTRVRAGDILLNVTGASIGRSCLVPDTFVPANVNQHVCIIRISDHLQRKFVAQVMKADVVKNQVALVQNGAARESLNFDQIGNLVFAIPLESRERSAIVDFLDRETDKINALVEEQRRLIELLKEKRQAVISHAVTKGLNPDAPMKHSGVEWLGQVPQHWEVRRISSLCTKITNGYVGPTRDILVGEGVRYLQSLHIKENAIRFNDPYFVRKEWSKAHEKSVLRKGDVLVVQTGDIGQVATVNEEFEGCNCHALIIISPLQTAVSGDWISWVLATDYGLHSLLSIQTGALHPHLNCGDVKDVFIPLPPTDEQQLLLGSLVKRIDALDRLIAEADRAIDLFQERRTALMSAAVTGKIDVRGLVEASVA